MYQAFFNLIWTVLFNEGIDNPVIGNYLFNLGIDGQTVGLDYYLSGLLALICTITVYVVVCLMIFKVIKLFGRLWSRF